MGKFPRDYNPLHFPSPVMPRLVLPPHQL